MKSERQMEGSWWTVANELFEQTSCEFTVTIQRGHATGTPASGRKDTR